MSDHSTIVVVIDGGAVQDILSDDDKIDVILIDHDNLGSATSEKDVIDQFKCFPVSELNTEVLMEKIEEQRVDYLDRVKDILKG
jgi:NADH/NAD ratio-sensing transcriptional regulator Rex